ncbi:MAG: polysaccharide biosynthesis tyrosine autokinase [Deltaproteobacteria bacterium]|nr:polysaccharide biosynthesis tyrosine autokinase [Deltaproteobacteria bacterium]
MLPSEKEIHLRDYWGVVLKHGHLAVIFFIIAVGVTSVYSFTAKPIYQGSAQILIDLESNPTVSFSEGGSALLQQRNILDYFNTQKEILYSRTFADRVVRRLQLDKNGYFLEKKAASRSSLAANILKSVKDIVKDNFPSNQGAAEQVTNAYLLKELDPELTDIVLREMQVALGGKASIIKINYVSDNPYMAAGMANGIANTYIEHNLDLRVRPFKDAVEWLSARMVDLRSKVEESEKALQKYKEGTGVVSFETKESVIVKSLQENASQLVQATIKRQEAETRYRQIRSVVDNPELLATSPDIMNNLVIQNLRISELNLKNQMSDLSEKFGPKHPQMVRTSNELQTIQKNLIAEARKMLNAAKTNYEIALSNETSIKTALDEQKKQVLDLSRKAIDFNVVAGESESNKQFYELLLKKLQEASLSSGVSISNVQVVDHATLPDTPIRPKKKLYILMSVIAGLFGGIIIVFFTEYMDDTIKTSDEVEQTLKLPFLAVLPSTKEQGPIYITAGTRSMIAEAYKTLRTNIMFSTPERPPKLLLITSATPEEGKTTVSSNLAVAMAMMGEKVLLIDADMRRHNIHKVFSLDNTIGLTNAIIDPATVPACIRPVPDCPNLSVITGGALSPNPLEMLSSHHMKDILTELGKNYDRVIMDSPPLLAVADSVILAHLADAVILVAWGGKTSIGLIKRALLIISNVKDLRILGVALNKIDVTKRGYYQYYPYYDYYTKDGEDTKRKRGKRHDRHTLPHTARH